MVMQTNVRKRLVSIKMRRAVNVNITRSVEIVRCVTLLTMMPPGNRQEFMMHMPANVSRIAT